MGGGFFGLEIARRGLDAQRKAIEVAAHNLANATTPGYSRRTVTMSPISLAGSTSVLEPVGAGVEIDAIRRVRDQFLDAQYRKENTRLAEWEAREGILQKAEIIFGEPSESGLRSAMDAFWSSLLELAANPESEAHRALVLERAEAVGEIMGMVRGQLVELRQDLDLEVRGQASRLNGIGKKVNDLQQQIRILSAAGGEVNDLLDLRDRLLDELSSLATVEVRQGPDDTVSVWVGNNMFLSPYGLKLLEVDSDPDDEGMAVLSWVDGPALDARGGRLAALLDLRDALIPAAIQDMESLARETAASFNGRHRSGYDQDGLPGGDFFDPAAGSPLFSLDPGVRGAGRRIAAASAPAAGDGSNAVVLAELRGAPVVGGVSPEEHLRKMVGGIGLQSQEARELSETRRLLVRQIDGQRRSVSEVNIDEEMALIIRYQRAYEAAARVVTVIDEMLETVINRLGVAGR
ncbi:MAG: flagellar hook-associated protein FlgK [Firmicutes bacterium]|nr:flagellar hook-associated protein FlgK [Bacillota bacterium]